MKQTIAEGVEHKLNLLDVPITRLILPVIVLVIALWAGLPDYQILVLVVISPLVLDMSITNYHRFVLRWFNPFREAQGRCKKGEGEAVIAELTAKRAQGMISPAEVIALASTYLYLGRGKEAEQAALEACGLLEQSGAVHHKNPLMRERYDIALIMLCGACNVQGRFNEAAQMGFNRIPEARSTNKLTFRAAWSFFLDKDLDNTAAVLFQIKPLNPFRKIKTHLEPDMPLLYYYMRYRVLGEDTLEELRGHREYLADWEDAARRHQNNPYGARLREVLDDIQQLMAEPVHK